MPWPAWMERSSLAIEACACVRIQVPKQLGVHEVGRREVAVSRDCRVLVSSEQCIYPCCTSKSNRRKEERRDILELKSRGEVFVRRMAHDRNLQKRMVQYYLKQSRENSEPYSHDTNFFFILVNSLYIKPQSREYRWSITMQAACSVR